MRKGIENKKERFMKKRIVLDTDLGGDCDDAVALAMLHNLTEEGKCSLELITLSLHYTGGCATARAINGYYRHAQIAVGADGEGRRCKRREYSEHIMKKFGCSDESDGGCVALLRKTLAEAEEKLTVIMIGPFTNMANLLESGADECSSLTGKQLIESKVVLLQNSG